MLEYRGVPEHDHATFFIGTTEDRGTDPADFVQEVLHDAVVPGRDGGYFPV